MLNSNAKVTVTHEESGKDYSGPSGFRAKGGGGGTAEATAIRPGGMAAPEAFPGPLADEEVTVSRLLRHGTDSGLVQELKGLRNERFLVVDQPLNAKGQAGFYKPEGHSGLLTGVMVSDYDADGTDPRTLDLTFIIDGSV